MRKTMFHAAARRELQQRLARLTPDRAPLWGTMNAPRMLVHVSDALKTGRYDLRPRLRSTFPPGTAPRTLVVQGTDDPLPIAASQELAGLLAARVVTLETGHAPHVEATADFVRTLDAFLPRS